MPRDYKHRATKKQPPTQPHRTAGWKWIMVAVLVLAFVYFLFFLQQSAPSNKQVTPVTISSKPEQQKLATKKSTQESPRFDFYTILPETEVAIPDYEINTRNREEQFGKAKKTQYSIQAGAFKKFPEADKLRASLALMGIESVVEKAKVGNTVWNRVKIGPLNRSSSVTLIKKRLKNNGIDAIVMELK